MIPKILHQVWVGGSPRPPDHIRYVESWRELHPDWEYRLWTDVEAAQLTLPVPYKSWTHFAAQANAIRIAAIYQFGGVYADCDTEFGKNFDKLTAHRSFAVLQQPQFYCNGIFGSIAGEPFLKYMLDELPNYVEHPSPWGPVLMTAAVKIHPPELLLPPYMFLPYMYGCPKQPVSDFPDAYSAHHWDMSWNNQAGGAR